MPSQHSFYKIFVFNQENYSLSKYIVENFLCKTAMLILCFVDKKGSSPDSEMVDDWVDNELFRIQSTLSQEVFDALEEKKGGSNICCFIWLQLWYNIVIGVNICIGICRLVDFHTITGSSKSILLTFWDIDFYNPTNKVRGIYIEITVCISIHQSICPHSFF